MDQITSNFAHLKEIRKRNTDPWFHPTSIADSISSKFNDTDEATKLYTEHVDIFKAKIMIIKKLLDLVIVPAIKPGNTSEKDPINYDLLEETKEDTSSTQ